MNDSHVREIERLQCRMKNLYEEEKSQNGPFPVSLQRHNSNSFTIRTKSYKRNTKSVDCHKLNRIIEIDPAQRIARVEPGVAMGQLLQAALPHGLTAAVCPEFKQITVGGAIVGMGAESGSHRWGCFNDICTAFELMTADGRVIQASPIENEALFYGIPGSYGSLGMLVSADIALIPAKECVYLRYHTFSSPQAAIQMLARRVSDPNAPDFLDGIIFSKELAVVIEGSLADKASISATPHFSGASIFSKFYWEHVLEIALKHPKNIYHEVMSHGDYFFRYDSAAFWMGSYLFNFPLSASLAMEVLQLNAFKDGFDAAEIRKFHRLAPAHAGKRILVKWLMSSSNLCKLLHKAEAWVQHRFVIQDFCLPQAKAMDFLKGILNYPAVFPIWMLPIKGTPYPQIFAPHLLKQEQKGHFINFGIYGIPAIAGPIERITRDLECKMNAYGGRKVLYSHTYFAKDEFWQVYDRVAYERLREQTCAKGFWLDIDDKVLTA